MTRARDHNGWHELNAAPGAAFKFATPHKFTYKYEFKIQVQYYVRILPAATDIDAPRSRRPFEWTGRLWASNLSTLSTSEIRIGTTDFHSMAEPEKPNELLAPVLARLQVGLLA